MSAGARPPSRAAAATGTALAPVSSRSAGWFGEPIMGERGRQDGSSFAGSKSCSSTSDPLSQGPSTAQLTHLPRVARRPAGPCGP